MASIARLPSLFGDDFVKPNENDAPPLTSLHLEHSFLGGLLFKPIMVEHVSPAFSAEHLYWPEHQDIFRSLAATRDDPRGGFAIIQTIALGDKELAEYVLGLLKSAVTWDKASTRTKSELLTDLFKRRRLVDIAYEIQTRANRPPVDAGSDYSCDPIAKQAMDELDKLTSLGRGGIYSTVTPLAATARAVSAGERTAAGTSLGINTGFRPIDRRIGGMEGGSMHVLAARPGMGKSALGLQIGVNVAESGIGVALLSLEMQSTQLGRRLLAWRSGVPQSVIRQGAWTESQAQCILEAQARIANLPMTIDDQGGVSTAQIGRKAAAAARKHGLGLIIVDHLHIIAQDAATTRMGATWGVGQVSNGLKRLAKDMGVPVLALAQLKRIEAREDKRPNLDDLRQSGEIEQDAETVTFIYREEYYLGNSPPPVKVGRPAEQSANARSQWEELRKAAAGKAELIFAKVRDGEPGTEILGWDGPTTSFFVPTKQDDIQEGFWV